MSEQRDKNRKDKNCREREREEKHKEKCEEPKKREKCKEVVKCPSFPICITTENKANVRVFGTPTSLTVPLNLNFLGLGTGTLAGIPYGITVTGTCASPTIVLTIGTVSIAVTPGTPCTAAVTPPVTTGINSSITVSGVPLIGYNGDPLSTTVLVSNLQIISRCAGTVVVQGTLNQTLALNGVAGPLPPDVLSTSATSLAAAIINAITALVTCAGSTLATLLPAEVITIITTFLPSITGTSTISDLIAAITPFILPGLSATLTSLFATASANVPVTLPVTDIPFTATLSDCALEGLGRKEKLCVKGTAILDSITPFALPLSATDLATPVSITGTSTCISVAFASEPLTIGTYLASIGITGSVIPAINCIMLTPGGSCTVFSPALTITDDVTICLNHGNACLCGPNNIAPRTIPGVATGFSGNCRTC